VTADKHDVGDIKRYYLMSVIHTTKLRHFINFSQPYIKYCVALVSNIVIGIQMVNAAIEVCAASDGQLVNENIMFVQGYNSIILPIYLHFYVYI
jgi:hypothetical protein